MDNFCYLNKRYHEGTESEEELLEYMKLIDTNGYMTSTAYDFLQPFHATLKNEPLDKYLHQALQNIHEEYNLGAIIVPARNGQSKGSSSVKEIFKDLHEKKQEGKAEQHRIEVISKPIALIPAKPFKQRYLAAAAVIVLIAVSPWLISNYKKSATQQDVTLPYLEAFEFTGKDYVHLPDGSTVMLKDNARISYTRSFGREDREVLLSGGEAFFDVVHDPKKPFKVRTGKVVTTVLGTAFDINAGQENNITVTVVRGRVAVGDDQGVFEYITPDQQITVNTINHEFKKKDVNAADITAWQKNYFILDHVTLLQAVQLIGERFDVKIIIANEDLKKCVINAWYLNGENYVNMVEDICTIYQATYTIKEKEILIEGGNGCKSE